MRPGMKTLWGAVPAAAGLLLVVLGAGRGLSDEPSRLGRLFRFGGTPAPTPAPPAAAPIVRDVGAGAPLLSSPSPASPPPVSSEPSLRITPRPRVSRAVTESDPIVTRVALGRSNDGIQFGMFLQVFADGTILDNAGTHHVGREALKPLLEVLQSSELARARGHCGAPATDFVEQVHVVVYERSYGRLRAHAFSHSGNTQGCDQAVQHLNKVLEELQSKISPPPTAAPAAPNVTPPPANAATTIPLTPGD